MLILAREVDVQELILSATGTRIITGANAQTLPNHARSSLPKMNARLTHALI